MSTNTKRAGYQNISIKCAICLQSLPVSNDGGKKQKYYYQICCETLKINNFPQLNSMSHDSNNNNTIRFCYNCTLTMKELNKLINKLASIQNSITQYEMDIKSKILKSYKQETPESTKRSKVTDIYTADRQYFRQMAVKDFLPIVRVPKVGCRQNISSECKKPIADPNWIQNLVYTETIVTKTEASDEDKIDIVKHEVYDNNFVANDSPFPENCDEFILSVSSNEDSFGIDTSTPPTVLSEVPLPDSGLESKSKLTNTLDRLSVSVECKTDSTQQKVTEKESDVEHDGNDDMQISDYECSNNQDGDSDYKPKSGKRRMKSVGKKLSSSSKNRQIQERHRMDKIGCEKKIQLEKTEKEKCSEVEHDGNDDMKNLDNECSNSNNQDVDSDYEPKSGKRRAKSTGNELSSNSKKRKTPNIPRSENKGSEEQPQLENTEKEKYSDVEHDGNDDMQNSDYECSNNQDEDSDYEPESSKRNVKSTGKNLSLSSKRSKIKDVSRVDKKVSVKKVPKERTKREKKPKRDQLQGVEFKIAEGKWCYRTIEYTYDEATSLYTCSLCSKTRKFQRKMRHHIGNYHGVEGYGKWNYAGVPYSLIKESGRFECSVCKKDFLDRNSVSVHIRDFHREKCQKLMKKIYSQDKRKQERGKCKSWLLSVPPVVLEKGKWLYREVEITKHNEDGKFHCGACGRIRKGWHSMLLHVVECHDEKAKLENECHVCGMQFPTSYRLKTHMQKHTERKTHQCELCGEFFQQKCSMTAHKARVHEMRRPHVCEYCAKSFFTRKDLRMHIRTHTKEKPYVCEFPGCGMSFAILQTMKNHMNSKVHQS